MCSSILFLRGGVSEWGKFTRVKISPLSLPPLLSKLVCQAKLDPHMCATADTNILAQMVHRGKYQHLPHLMYTILASVIRKSL